MKEFLKSRKRYIIEIILLLFILFAASKLVKILMVFPASESYKTTVITADDPDIKEPDERSLARYDHLLLLQEGDVLEQYFYAVDDILSGVQLVFIVDGDLTAQYTDLTGDMDIRVSDAATGEILCNINKSLADILWIDNSILPVDEVLTGVKGKQYKITVTVNHVDPRRDVYIDLTAGNVYTSGEMLINGEESSQDFILSQSCNKYTFLISAYRIFVFCFAVTVLLVYYLMRIRKARLENVYLVLAVFLGLAYMAFLPPYAAPDDQTHLNNSYNYVNRIMGVASTGNPNTIYMRAEDAGTGLSYQPSLDEYEHIYYDLFSMSQNNSLVETGYNSSLNAAWYAYIPGILGILLGRLFGLGGLMTLYLGKFMQYAAFVLAVYFVIKFVKRGKMIFLTTALLPMVLQQTTSYSYDVTVLIAAFVFTAICLNLSEKEAKLKLPHMIGIVALTVFLIKMKMGAYLPVCLLVLLIHREAYKNKKQRRIALSVYFVFCMAVFLSGRLGYFIQIAGNQQTASASVVMASGSDGTDEGNETDVPDEAEEASAAPERVYENYIAWADSEGYTIGYILHNPGLIPKILINTVQMYGSEYVEGMIGNPIGWSNYGWYYPNLIIYLFVLLLLLATVTKLEDTSEGLLVIEKTMTLRERVVSWLAVIGTAGCIVAGMWFSWTPISFHYIVGVQGRYFLPVLPVFLFTVRNKCITTKKSLNAVIITAILVLHVWCFWTIGCCTGMMI